jgi:hypothetical protein
MLSPSHDEVADLYLEDLAAAVEGARGAGDSPSAAPTRYA